MAIDVTNGVSMRINLAPKMSAPSSPGFMSNLLRSTVLATALKVGLPITAAMGAFGLAGCEGPTAGVNCNNNVSVFDPNGTINRGLLKTANMYISGGRMKFSVDIDVPGGDAIGSLDETSLGGNLYLKVFSSPAKIGADASGNLAIKGSTDTDYSACTTAIADCTPFSGLYGMVPVAFVQRVQLPTDVTPGSDEALQYAVGGKILHEVGGDGLYAVLSRMNVYVTEDGAKVYKPVWQYGGDLVVQIKAKDCSSDDLDDPCTTTIKYYKVDPSGVVTDQEITVSDESSLVEAFGYYQITPAGKYLYTNADGSPKADPTLANLDFELLKDPNITLKDIIAGNEDKDIGGLAMKDDGTLDLSLLAGQELNFDIALTAADLRSPSVGSQTVAPDLQLAGEADAYEYKLERVMYSNGQFKFRLTMEGKGDGMTIAQTEYFYLFVVDARLVLKDVPEQTCE